jgi:hypothetical protein
MVSSMLAISCALVSMAGMLDGSSTRMLPSRTGSLQKAFRRCCLSFLACLPLRTDFVLLVVQWSQVRSLVLCWYQTG